MRLFFGVFPSPPVRDEVVRILGRDQAKVPSLHWVASEQMHVTLQFLGELDQERASVAERVARDLAPRHAPFALSFGGYGVFPSAHRPSVLWLGVEQGDALIRLAEELGSALRAAGFVLDARAYHPHLTLARIKNRKQAAEVTGLLDTSQRPSSSVFEVDSFVLLESRGGFYLPLATFALSPMITPETAR